MSGDVQSTFRFAEVEAILADLNGVQSHQRAAFQARLKNFLRLGFPANVGKGRGKVATYEIRELLQLAIAVELTQLGLTPERAIDVFNDDPYPVWMCLMMAASALIRTPGGFSPEWQDNEDTDPDSFFLYLDPAALSPWDEEGTDRASSTFFFGGTGIVKENITRWTTGPTRRLALINVSALLWQMAAYVAGEEGDKFLVQVFNLSQDWELAGDFDLDEWLQSVAKNMAMMVAAQPKWLTEMERDDEQHGWRRVTQLFDPDDPDDQLGRYVVYSKQPEDIHDKSVPDMIIRLPGQRELIVDDKTIPTADIPQQAIIDRIDELAELPYRTPYSDRTEWTVLYVRSERFFAGAVAVEKNLFEYALSKKVVIVTPAILVNLVAEVATAWDKYRAEHGDEEFEALPSKATVYGDHQEA